jgi:hypothetical protein
MLAKRKPFRTLSIALVAVLLLGFGPAPGGGFDSASAQEEAYSREEIEAAFLYRFASFVSWPRHALPQSAFTVAVMNDDDLAADLDRILPGNPIKGRRAELRRITSIGQLGDAQILFIGGSDASKLKRWLAPLAGRPVLVVTSQPGALDDGSIINFLMVDRHVRFEISLAAARRSGLTISADLLSVATHIEGGPVGSQPPCALSPSRLRLGSCSPKLASK